jgi:hypothetical protein
MEIKESTKAAHSKESTEAFDFNEVSRCLGDMLQELEIREFVYALDVGALPAEVFCLFF